jgi:hypothetical protein
MTLRLQSDTGIWQERGTRGTAVGLPQASSVLHEVIAKAELAELPGSLAARPGRESQLELTFNSEPQARTSHFACHLLYGPIGLLACVATEKTHYTCQESAKCQLFISFHNILTHSWP